MCYGSDGRGHDTEKQTPEYCSTAIISLSSAIITSYNIHCRPQPGLFSGVPWFPPSDDRIYSYQHLTSTVITDPHVRENYFEQRCLEIILEEKLEILHDWVYQDWRVGLQVPDFIMFSIIKSSDRFLKTDWKICFVFLVSNLVISPHEISPSDFPAAAPCPGPNQFKFMILE